MWPVTQPRRERDRAFLTRPFPPIYEYVTIERLQFTTKREIPSRCEREWCEPGNAVTEVRKSRDVKCSVAARRTKFFPPPRDAPGRRGRLNSCLVHSWRRLPTWVQTVLN